MTVFIEGKEKRALHGPPPKEAKAVFFVPSSEASQDLKALHLRSILLDHPVEGETSRFESHADFDCVVLNIPDRQDMFKPLRHIDIYLTGNDLLFVHDDLPVIEKLVGLLRDNEAHSGEAIPPERVLYHFFNLLTERDSAFLQDIEEDIAALEDDIAHDKPLDYNEAISVLRKKMMQWKRYYEALFDLLVDLEENQNHFLTKSGLHALHIITNRADRLARSVLNLRDYVTQVREAYQSQIDIRLNRTMKLFTVVTTIFLPLSLIAGWYGMNLKMPEYNWAFSYPGVIVLSIAVVVGCLAYFKKEKWF